MEDAERVLVAFLVATAALGQGKQVVVWATKDAVRLGLPGEMSGVACEGCPPLERLLEQFTEGGGELWLCPICLSARKLSDEEKSSTPRWSALRRCGNGLGATPRCSATKSTRLVTSQHRTRTGRAIESTLTAEERERLTAELRPKVENGRGTWRMATDYLAAKP